MSKNIFLGAFWTLVHFLWRSVHSDALTISKLGYLSVYCYILRVVYVFWILVPYQTRFPKIVSHSVYVFYFLDGASEVQINSDEVQFIYFFPLVACDFVAETIT